jgi:hypothetical protein
LLKKVKMYSKEKTFSPSEMEKKAQGQFFKALEMLYNRCTECIKLREYSSLD